MGEAEQVSLPLLSQSCSYRPQQQTCLPQECLQCLQHVMSNIAHNVDVKKEDRASKLLQLSRTEAGRQLLVDYSAVALLPSALKSISEICTPDVQQPQHWDALIWTLQFTRNLCAAGDAACVSLLQAGVLDTVLDLIDKLQVSGKGVDA